MSEWSGTHHAYPNESLEERQLVGVGSLLSVCGSQVQLRSPSGLELSQLSHLTRPPTLLETGSRPRLASNSVCSWGTSSLVPFSAAGVPCHRREEDRVEFPSGQHPEGSWMGCGVWSLVLRHPASVCSTRMACTGCTRMCITSAPSTRCRAYRCCSARLECAQVRRGWGTVQACGPPLTHSSQSSSHSQPM